MSHPLVAQAREFQSALLVWYRRQARRLPWRDQPSLYRTVVSEFMLQQTQVKTVLPYFDRWMIALPDFAALAAAPEAQVLRLWEGLGYYTRARNLQRLARALVSRPAPPCTPGEWVQLPGVGPYTAAAITSITFGASAACVDGNVVRILARLTADATRFRDGSAAARHFTPLAAALLPAENPGDHNQAMMELGATVCVRPSPACRVCPVQRFCAASQRKDPTAYPRFAPRILEQRHIVRLWCEQAGTLLLHRIPDSARRLAQLHELPTAAQAGLDDASVTRGRLLARRRRGITRFAITEEIFQVDASALTATAASAELIWIPLAGLSALPLSGPHRRWIQEILAEHGDAQGQ